ncbi:MAG: hypothetical protein KTR30_09215, partial [Saprospiraceae bacterium]|nr:hypothetical protein [Saprospiraceae bacterium]
MRKVILLLGIILYSQSFVQAQFTNEDIKVYDIEDGLSHRNVFKIQQDDYGFIWMATINGLNRFDGSGFITFSSQSEEHKLPYNTISDMIIAQDGKVYLAHPDFVSVLHPEQRALQLKKIKDGPIIRRESMVPHNLMRDTLERIWMATYDERSGKTSIQILSPDSSLQTLLEVPGQYPKRPLLHHQGAYYVGAF